MIIANVYAMPKIFRVETHIILSEMLYGRLELEIYFGSIIVSCSRISFPCFKKEVG